MQENRPEKQFRGDAYDSKADIPQGLRGALDLFDAAEAVHDVLGPEFARVYSIVKSTEAYQLRGYSPCLSLAKSRFIRSGADVRAPRAK